MDKEKNRKKDRVLKVEVQNLTINMGAEVTNGSEPRPIGDILPEVLREALSKSRKNNLSVASGIVGYQIERAQRFSSSDPGYEEVQLALASLRIAQEAITHARGHLSNAASAVSHESSQDIAGSDTVN